MGQYTLSEYPVRQSSLFRTPQVQSYECRSGETVWKYVRIFNQYCISPSQPLQQLWTHLISMLSDLVVIEYTVACVEPAGLWKLVISFSLSAPWVLKLVLAWTFVLSKTAVWTVRGDLVTILNAIVQQSPNQIFLSLWELVTEREQQRLLFCFVACRKGSDFLSYDFLFCHHECNQICGRPNTIGLYVQLFFAACFLSL